MLVVVSGLPGVGKTAVAAALAARRSALHLSIDLVEDALLGAGLAPGWATGVAAYEAVRAMATPNLACGLTVVVDAVNDSAAARTTWVRAASDAVADLRFVVLAPPPAGEHRRRLVGRGARFRHLPEPTWDDVQLRAARHEPWAADLPLLRVAAGPPVAVLVDVVEAARPG